MVDFFPFQGSNWMALYELYFRREFSSVLSTHDITKWDPLIWSINNPPLTLVINSNFSLVSVQFSSVSHVRLFATPWIAARPPCPSPTPRVHSDSPPSSQWCHLAISSSAVPFSSCPQSLPASEPFPVSQLCMRWPKYWSFSFSIILSKEIPGLISFKMDWLDLLAAQGTLKSLLQHHSSKASILRRSAFFTVQLLHPYMTTGKWIGYLPSERQSWQGEKKKGKLGTQETSR